VEQGRDNLLLALNMLWDIGRTLELDPVVDRLRAGALLGQVADHLTRASVPWFFAGAPDTGEADLAGRFDPDLVWAELRSVFTALSDRWEIVR
jgi:hypothetical protein